MFMLWLHGVWKQFVHLADNPNHDLKSERLIAEEFVLVWEDEAHFRFSILDKLYENNFYFYQADFEAILIKTQKANFLLRF